MTIVRSMLSVVAAALLFVLALASPAAADGPKEGQFCSKGAEPVGSLVCVLDEDGKHSHWRKKSSASPTPSAVDPSPSARTSSVPSSSAASTLPITGSTTVPLVLLGSGVIVAGAVAAVASRRRRVRFQA